MPSFHFLCLDFLLCLSEIIRCEVTYCLKTWREKRALLCGSPAVQPFSFKGQHAQNLLSHSRPNRHSLPPCFPALTIPIFCTLFFHKLQSVRCWKLPGNCSKEPRCDKWTNSSVLAHSYPEGPWEPWILAQPPGNQPAGHKEERTTASIWWGLFPWDAAVAVGKAEHNIPNLRIRIRMLLLVKELCLESASSGKPPHIGIAGRIPTKCLLLLFAGWGIVLALKASNWYSSFFLLSSMCFQTQVWNSVDGNYTSTLIFKPQTQLAH